MSPPVFVDANVPIYAAGRPHPLKDPCVRILRLAAERPRTFFTDAEVLQELLHRYLALRLWPQGREVLERFSTIMRGRVEPVYATDIEAAAALADRYLSSGLAARDLLHVAVTTRVGAREVVSADRDYVKFSEIELLEPKDLDAWLPRLEA